MPYKVDTFRPLFLVIAIRMWEEIFNQPCKKKKKKLTLPLKLIDNRTERQYNAE